MSIVSGTELPKSGAALREPGLWHRLVGGDIEQHEAEVYGKAVQTGGVTLAVAEQDIPSAMGILNQDEMVDVQERAVQRGLLSKEDVEAPAPAVAAALPTKPVTADMSREQVLRLAEKQLEVGKNRQQVLAHR